MLAENGFNDQVFRSQSRIHNKGIIADGARVLVSSQNWSGDGFLRNRDAGIIVDNSEVAEVLRSHLRQRLGTAREVAVRRGLNARLAGDSEATPPGMVRMSWRDYFGD